MFRFFADVFLVLRDPPDQLWRLSSVCSGRFRCPYGMARFVRPYALGGFVDCQCLRCRGFLADRSQFRANSGRTVELSALRRATITTEPWCCNPSDHFDAVEF
jgi:hypothetical protein